MAGDWIKMETELHEKPEVFAISSALKMNRFEVVGRLHRVWSWYNKHTENGHASSVTSVTVDEVAGRDGFASAMIAAGWGAESDGIFSIPKFDRHNGSTAKSRAQAAERQGRSRANRDKCHARTVTEAQPEKRREEKIEESIHSGPKRPTLDQAKAAASQIGVSPAVADEWWHAREATDWQKGTPGGGQVSIGQNWQADLKTYASRMAQARPASQPPKHRQGEFAEEPMKIRRL